MRLVIYFFYLTFTYKSTLSSSKQFLWEATHRRRRCSHSRQQCWKSSCTQKCPQLVCHGLLDVVHSSKMTTFEVEFEFWEKEEVTCTQIRQVWWLRNHRNTLFGQKFVHGYGSVTGSTVVMQHPSFRNLCPDTMNPFSESFKELTIVLFINCLSLRHEFLMKNALTVEKTNQHSFDF